MLSRPEAYQRVVATIEQHGGSTISVPDLSKLLGVKPTTLNARFRREQIEIQTIGRTNYIPQDLALRLAELHKYALFGWPTLQEASLITTVKDGTLKAWCEKGKLEGYLDLTKRLRIKPADLDRLQPVRAGRIPIGNRGSVQPHPLIQVVPKAERLFPRSVGSALSVPKNMTTNGATARTNPASATPRNGHRDPISFPARPPQFPPAPEPHVELITRKSYGLPEVETTTANKGPAVRARTSARERSPWLDYLPDRPFSISECRVGKVIHYGPHDGTIIKLIDDPFAPRIQVHFPAHPHPAMREVQLIVGKRRMPPAR